jgi:hypothetical protein
VIRWLTAGLLLTVCSAANAQPLEFHNGRLFIRATVNHVPTEALLDSGAEATVVDPQLAARAKLPQGTPQLIKGSGGTAQARLVEGVTVRALGVELHPEAIVVLDLAEVSQRLIKRATQAIIGRELFDAARLRIDIARGDIAVVDRSRAPAGKKLALAGNAGIEAIPALANGLPARADFDLGNGSDVLISRDFARRLKLKIIGKKPGGGIGGAIERDLVRLSSLIVAGKRFDNVVAAIDDQPSHNDLNVGTAILKSFLITTDFRQRLVWLQPISRTY